MPKTPDGFLSPLPLPQHDNLTVREVARFLRVSQTVIYEMVADNELPAKRIRHQIRIPRNEFLRWFSA